MSIDFVKERKNARHIATAVKQQKQINYFIQSKTQDDITQEYLKQWAERKYVTDDFFLNWVKNVFKTQNFLSFFKYLRNPLPSAKIVNDEIKPQLKRVFYAEDGYSKFIVRGKEVPTPKELESAKFEEMIFDALLFRFNDIIVTDLKEVNTPFRQIICIENVIAIDSDNGVIEKVAYCAEIEDEFGNEVHGYLYIDKLAYIFYDKDYKVVKEIPHDLGECPADYISKEAFSSDNDIVRKSIFSYVKTDFEEYVFLKTIQRMTEPNGAIPVVTMLKTREKTNEGTDAKTSPGEPMASNTITSQKATVSSEVNENLSPMQAGTIIKVPRVEDKNTGKIDMDVVKNFLNFFHTPTECLEFLNKRIGELRKDIINSVLGDYQEQNQSAKNELQVGKSYDNKDDNLRAFALNMSVVVSNSDRKFLGLKYGISNVFAERFFGSSFFLETQAELFDLFKNSPNVIERKNILVKMNQNQNRFNKTKAQRDKILYDLLPYVSDADFKTALEQQVVSQEVKMLQTQFTYYISLFEASNGDLVEFYQSLNASDSEKLIYIKNILTELIKQDMVVIQPQVA